MITKDTVHRLLLQHSTDDSYCIRIAFERVGDLAQAIADAANADPDRDPTLDEDVRSLIGANLRCSDQDPDNEFFKGKLFAYGTVLSLMENNFSLQTVDEIIESCRLREERPVTDGVVRAAMKAVAKDVRAPKAVRDGLVKPTKRLDPEDIKNHTTVDVATRMDRSEVDRVAGEITNDIMDRLRNIDDESPTVDWQGLAQFLEDWLNEEHAPSIPQAGRDVMQSNANDGVPTSCGWHDSVGYFVLSTSGQGPCVDWSERAPTEGRFVL